MIKIENNWLLLLFDDKILSFFTYLQILFLFWFLLDYYIDTDNAKEIESLNCLNSHRCLRIGNILFITLKQS